MPFLNFIQQQVIYVVASAALAHTEGHMNLKYLRYVYHPQVDY